MNKVSIYFVCSIFGIMVFGSFSNIPAVSAVGNQISLEDLGILQLAAHDFFNVDRGDRVNANTATDFENGRLDLSTLFVDMTTGTPFSKETVAIGGEPRNRENIILFTVANDLGTDYKNYIDNDGMTEAQARQLVLDDYHSRLNTAFFNAFGQTAPGAAYGCATMTENLALRTVHDFLPEFIQIDGNPVSTLSFIPPFNDGPLTPAQMAQPTSMLDGLFDTAFTEPILINIPPSTVIEIPSLLEADQTFGDQFSTDFSFDFFLSELIDGSYDSGEHSLVYITDLFAKGLGGGCSVGGKSLPIDSISLMAGAAQSSTWIIPVALSILGIGMFVASRSENLSLK